MTLSDNIEVEKTADFCCLRSEYLYDNVYLHVV